MAPLFGSSLWRGLYPAPGLWAGLWQLGGTGRGWRDPRTPKAGSGEAGSLRCTSRVLCSGLHIHTCTDTCTHVHLHTHTPTHAHRIQLWTRLSMLHGPRGQACPALPAALFREHLAHLLIGPPLLPEGTS